jgi:hypothetical protein
VTYRATSRVSSPSLASTRNAEVSFVSVSVSDSIRRRPLVEEVASSRELFGFRISSVTFVTAVGNEKRVLAPPNFNRRSEPTFEDDAYASRVSAPESVPALAVPERPPAPERPKEVRLGTAKMTRRTRTSSSAARPVDASSRPIRAAAAAASAAATASDSPTSPSVAYATALAKHASTSSTSRPSGNASGTSVEPTGTPTRYPSGESAENPTRGDDTGVVSSGRPEGARRDVPAVRCSSGARLSRCSSWRWRVAALPRESRGGGGVAVAAKRACEAAAFSESAASARRARRDKSDDDKPLRASWSVTRSSWSSSRTTGTFTVTTFPPSSPPPPRKSRLRSPRGDNESCAATAGMSRLWT